MLFTHIFSFFFFNDTATTEIYTLSLHDALPISVARDRRGSARGVPALHRDPQAIRPPDRELSGRAFRARGHGHGDRGREAPGVPRRLAQAAPPAVQARGGDGEAVRVRAGDARHDQGRPAARRLRLHHGLPSGADDAGREDLRDRRGHERDSAHRNRETTIWGSGGLGGGGRRTTWDL